MGGLEATLLQTYAGRQRHTCVLVAAMSAREGQRPASAEPAAVGAIARCLEALAHAAEANGGRVLRNRGNELIALFADADGAAAAAARMQYEADGLLRDGELTLRVAFHGGPLRQRGHGIYGEALNVAAELAGLADAGQILVSHDTAAGLGADFAHAVHELRFQAKHAAVALEELDWHGIAPECRKRSAKPRPPELHLTYRYNTLVRRREGDCVTIGRDPDCDLAVDVRLASRRHCTLERRGHSFVLRDHSTNGTFITVDGEREVRIRVEEIVLRGRGWLSFGASRLLAEELVQFRCQ